MSEVEPTPEECLRATTIVDSDHPDVRAWASQHAKGSTDKERAIALYYKVRDDFRYDPYKFDISINGLKASTCLNNKYGWCVPKANLLAAVLRAVGIPARLGYADVRNHLSTERMRKTMTTDIFHWHGYVDIWINGKWVKATPAFNIQLTEKFGLLPLDFDGENDSIYHEFDKKGNRHMEYLNYRGTFVECPREEMVKTFNKTDPEIMKDDNKGRLADFDFEKDVAAETAGNGPATARL